MVDEKPDVVWTLAQRGISRDGGQPEEGPPERSSGHCFLEVAVGRRDQPDVRRDFAAETAAASLQDAST
jgi:hypothetical protein